MVKVSKQELEKHRKVWAEVAKKHGWYSEPFYVQIWVDNDGSVVDSVSVRDLKQDFVISAEDDVEIEFELV